MEAKQEPISKAQRLRDVIRAAGPDGITVVALAGIMGCDFSSQIAGHLSKMVKAGTITRAGEYRKYRYICTESEEKLKLTVRDRVDICLRALPPGLYTTAQLIAAIEAEYKGSFNMRGREFRRSLFPLKQAGYVRVAKREGNTCWYELGSTAPRPQPAQIAQPELWRLLLRSSLPATPTPARIVRGIAQI